MLTQSASISQFQAMVLQPELLCDMMASGKILRIAISSRDRDQLQQLYNDQEALARIIRQAMDLMRQKIVIPRDACQALPLAVQDNGPKKLFLQGASRSRSHEAPQTRSGIEAGWRMFTAGHTGPEQIWRMNTQGGGGRRPQTVQHLRTQAAFSMEEDCQIPYGAPMAFYGRGIPEQAWKAFNELDDSEIHEFIHFIFQINVFNLEEDSENPGQYVFTINFAAFQQLLEFLESLKPETGRVKELSSTDEEAESEFNTAMSSDDEDDEIILVVPDKELKAAEPVVKASPVCASEVTNTAASTKMPAALLCASIILGLLLV